MSRFSLQALFMTVLIPTETSLIYTHYKIIKVLPYLLMSDADSCSLEFIAIAEDSCDCGEPEMRGILLRIFLDNDIQHRLDLSGDIFAQFKKRNEAVREQVGLYKFENVQHRIICTICVDPKDYFELYRIYYETNKKHEDVRKVTKGMDFNNYTSRILTIEEAKKVRGGLLKSKSRPVREHGDGSYCKV